VFFLSLQSIQSIITHTRAAYSGEKGGNLQEK
jgi:hypothetical protein